MNKSCYMTISEIPLFLYLILTNQDILFCENIYLKNYLTFVI